MTVRGPTSPSVRPQQPAPTTAPTTAQTTAPAARPQAAASPAPSTPAAQTTPQSAHATPQSSAEAQTARSRDVTASQMQQRLGGTLGRDDAQGAQEGHGVNRAGGALRSGTGPLPADAWTDPARNVLGRLTQHSARGVQDGTSDGSRCGPANLLGSTIMRGQEPTARLLETTAGDTGAQLSETDRASLRTIASEVRGGTATFEQLNQAQDLLYRGSNTTQEFDEVRAQALGRVGTLPAADRTRFRALDQQYQASTMTQADLTEYSALISRATGVDTTPRVAGGTVSVDVQGSRATSRLAGGYSDTEVSDAARRGGIGTGTQRPLDQAQMEADGTSRALRAQLETLQPGQAATVRVAGSDAAMRLGEANHFITVGRQADGTPYIYNPDPERGRPTVYVGSGTNPAQQSADFAREIRRYENRIAFSETPIQATITGP